MSVAPTVAIMGYGYVGQAVSRLFSAYQQVIYDADSTLLTPGLPATVENLQKCDIAFVCVPTPGALELSNPAAPLHAIPADTSAVCSALEGLPVRLVVIKSTVPPGTTRSLNLAHPTKSIVFSPEFIGESKYYSPYPADTGDMAAESRYIFGGEPSAVDAVINFYLPVTGPHKQYLKTSWEAAELTKYVTNCYGTAKIAFCHQMSQIATALGISWHEVRELWLSDPRVEPSWTAVMPEQKPAVSGKCLPKDLRALIATAEALGVDSRLLDSVAAVVLD